MFCAMLMCSLKLGYVLCYANVFSETGVFCAMLMCFLKLGYVLCHVSVFSETGICFVPC